MHYNPNILHKLWNTHIICLFFCGKIPVITQYSSFFVPAERWENNAFPTRVGKIVFKIHPPGGICGTVRVFYNHKF